MSAAGAAAILGLDPQAAAEELLAGALVGLDGPPSLAILFASSGAKAGELVPSVAQRLGGAPIWGGSSSTGVLSSGNWLAAQGGAAAMMLISGRRAGVAICETGGDPTAAGYEAAALAIKRAGGSAGALLVIAYPGAEEAVLAGIGWAAPGIPVIGGSASDHSPRQDFLQFGDGRIERRSVSVAAIAGPVGHCFVHGYEVGMHTARVTRASARKLIQLDGQPAVEVYQRWTGAASEQIAGANILSYSVFHPLLLQSDAGEIAVHPVCANPDGSIDTGVILAPGSKISLGLGTADALLQGVSDALRIAAKDVSRPEGMILAHCGGRALALQARIDEVPRHVQSVVGNIPWIGFLAFGEQGSLGAQTRPVHANLSLSALVF